MIILMKLISLSRATSSKHKYTATIKDPQNRLHHIHFGARGYDDFTTTNDEQRKKSYLARHGVTENWTSSGILTAGFWSRWVLWNKKSVSASLQDLKKRFNI